jgi:hypothetical protein
MRHIFDAMQLSQRVLDYEDIPAFNMFNIPNPKFSQEAIRRRQVHEIFTEDGEGCWVSVASAIITTSVKFLPNVPKIRPCNAPPMRTSYLT